MAAAGRAARLLRRLAHPALSSPAGLAAALVMGALASTAEAFPSVQAPGGDIVLHEYFVEVHAGSIPPDVVGLARLDSQGQPKSGFGRNGFAVERATPGVALERAHVAMDDSGRLSVAVTPTGSQAARVRRYLPDGSRDWSLGGDGEIQIGVPAARFEAADLLALPGGVLLLGAGLMADGAQWRTLALARIKSDGTLDMAFGGGDGIATADDGAGPSVASRIRITDNGLLAGGDGLVALFTPAGALDPSFGGDGMMRGSLPGVVDAAGDGAVIAARASSPHDGIVVERLTEDGTLDGSWGDGGRSTLKLSAKDYDTDADGNQFGDQISYSVAEVISLADGRVLVGATQHRVPYDFTIADCGSNSGTLVLLTPGGGLESTGVGPPANVEHVLPLPDGEVLVTGDIDSVFNCGFDPGFAHYGQLARYDADLDMLSGTSVRPVVAPPGIEIASGPPPVSGPDAVFRFSVAPGPLDNGDVAVECALDGARWAGCPLELHLDDLAVGPHSLTVRALGIHGAPSDVRTWEWTVAASTTPSAPALAGDPRAAIRAFAAADALQITRIVRRLGLRRLARRGRFRVTADATVAGLWRARLSVRRRDAGAAHTVTLARARASFAGPGARRVAVRLTRRGRRLLRGSRRALRLRARVSFSAIDRLPLSGGRTVLVRRAGR